MITRQQLLDSMIQECEIIKHLYTKIPAGTFDFRPSEGQRSTLELLRYLAVCGSAPIHVMLNDSDWKTWKPFTANLAEMKAEEFPAAMDKQIEDIKRMVNSIPDEDFAGKEAKHPMGHTMPFGLALVRMPLGWLTAYRMQLFLYAKQCGATDIGTSNNWSGIDRPKK